MKWLMIAGFGLLVVSILAVIGGVSGQQPFLFGFAVLCGSPVSMFFLGGGLTLLLSKYRISEKEDAPRAVGKSRQGRAGEMG